MTLQEAKEMMEGYQITDAVDRAEFDAFGLAIQALEEVEQYRAIGLTPEQIEAMQGHNVALINDLGEYQSLGTVEELKESREKQMAKKVISWQGKKHICPFCHRDIVRTEALDVHCKYCGQALNWGEEDD